MAKTYISAGELADAKRRALNAFDKWNDVTGQFTRGTSYYYEAQGCIEDAVHIGAQAALGVYKQLDSEKD